VNEPNREKVIELLALWRGAATRTRGLLRARGDMPKTLASAFSGAFTAITDARSKLRQPTADVLASTEPAMQAIDKVTDELGELSGQLLADPQGATDA
jgi:hypothetical protein